MPFDINDPQQVAAFEAVRDRFNTYEQRCHCYQDNAATTKQAMDEAAGQPFVVQALNEDAYIKPSATVNPYIEEPNNGPKSGIRPSYFLDVETAKNATVDVTISGDILTPEAGTFSYTAAGIDKTLPMADFLAAVVAGIGTPADVYVGVERDQTCLGIAGQTGYTIDAVVITIV